VKLKLQPLTSDLNVLDQAAEVSSVERDSAEIFYPENSRLAKRAEWRKWLRRGFSVLLITSLYLGMLYGYWQLRSAELEKNFIALKASVK